MVGCDLGGLAHGGSAQVLVTAVMMATTCTNTAGPIAAGARVTVTIVAMHREAGCRQRNTAGAAGAGTDTRGRR